MNTSIQQSGGFNSGIFITFGSQNLMDPESCNLVFLRDMFSVLEIRDEIFSSLGRLGRSGRTRADAMGDVALSLFYVTICCVVIDVQLLHWWDREVGCCSLDWD